MRPLLTLFLYLSSVISNPVPHTETEPVVPNVVFDPVAEVYSYADISTPPIAIESVSLLDSQTVGRNEWSLPIDWDITSVAALSKPHHDYPANDILVPVGTNIYAITSGTVIVATGNNGEACGGEVLLRTDVGDFMYCHLSKVVVQSGTTVEAGQLVGLSGGRPGAYGAGSSTTPHLHIGLTRSGRLWCSQPLLVSIAKGEEVDLTNTTRCVG